MLIEKLDSLQPVRRIVLDKAYEPSYRFTVVFEYAVDQLLYLDDRSLRVKTDLSRIDLSSSRMLHDIVDNHAGRGSWPEDL